MARAHQPGQATFRSILPEDIDWKPFPAFPPSARLAVVVGHPSEPAPYVVRVKVPSGVKLMPHRHHTLVHDKGYLIASTPGGFTFYSPQGTPMPACPKLRAGPGDITTTHDAVITPATIIPPNSGGRLDLNLAIWITFANARVKTEHREREQASPAA